MGGVSVEAEEGGLVITETVALLCGSGGLVLVTVEVDTEIPPVS
jgi:hypothetical protein